MGKAGIGAIVAGVAGLGALGGAYYAYSKSTPITYKEVDMTEYNESVNGQKKSRYVTRDTARYKEESSLKTRRSEALINAFLTDVVNNKSSFSSYPFSSSNSAWICRHEGAAKWNMIRAGSFMQVLYKFQSGLAMMSCPDGRSFHLPIQHPNFLYVTTHTNSSNNTKYTRVKIEFRYGTSDGSVSKLSYECKKDIPDNIKQELILYFKYYDATVKQNVQIDARGDEQPATSVVVAVDDKRKEQEDKINRFLVGLDKNDYRWHNKGRFNTDDDNYGERQRFWRNTPQLSIQDGKLVITSSSSSSSSEEKEPPMMMLDIAKKVHLTIENNKEKRWSEEPLDTIFSITYSENKRDTLTYKCYKPIDDDIENALVEYFGSFPDVSPTNTTTYY